MNFQNVFFSLCQSLREGSFSLSKTLNFEELSFCEKIRSSFPKKSSLQEFDGSKNSSGSWLSFLFLLPCLDCAPKVIDTEAEIFAKWLGIAFTFQTDVRSCWGKKLRKLECYQRICGNLWQFYWIFLPRVKPPLSQTQRIFWEVTTSYRSQNVHHYYSSVAEMWKTWKKTSKKAMQIKFGNFIE